MIQLRGVTFTYEDAPAPTLRDIDLTVRDGEWLLLAGPSGCGKSTLLHAINGLIPHVIAGQLTGEILVDGRIPSKTPIEQLSRYVGTVFQNPELQLFMLRVEDDVAFGCENLGYSPQETWRRTNWALDNLSLAAHRHQTVATLSGGQKQRLAVAGLLAMGSQILLLDEPTSDLDESGCDELLRTLKQLHRQGHTIILCEHRWDRLHGLVDRVVTMDEGAVILDGPFPKADPLPPSHPVTRGRDTEPLVKAHGIGFTYPNRDRLLEDVTFDLRAGEVVALTGDNGAGKTTLLKLLCGLLRPDRGALCVTGVRQPRTRELVGKVGFLFQNPDEQIFTDRVADEIAFGPKQLGREVDVNHYLARTGLLRFYTAHPRCCRGVNDSGLQRLPCSPCNRNSFSWTNQRLALTRPRGWR